MLMENTGIAMLDSGGGEGRMWQKNAKRDIRKDKPVELDLPRNCYTLEQNGQFVRRGDTKAELMAYKGLSAKEMGSEGYTIRHDKPMSDEIVITVSLYHYLPQVLELDETCDAFNSKFAKMDDWESDAYGVSKEAAEWLKTKGLEFGDSWNTYNGEDNLSQTLQGTNVNTTENKSNFEYPEYVLLQVHGGADVRGGYTDAKLFKMQDDQMIDPTPRVYGQIKRKGVEPIPLQMRDNGCGFELEDVEKGYGGEPVEILEGDEVEAWLEER